jgi:replicative DNA helicase
MGQQGQEDGARFAVGFSYAGENRALVAPLAEELARRCGRQRVLFDRFHEAELARPDLDVYLPRLYRDETELIVVLLSPDYPNKRWCGLEWRWIRQLILNHAQERIMLLRAGNPGDLSELGILAGDGYLDVSARAAADISSRILERMVQQGIRIPEAAQPALTALAANPPLRKKPQDCPSEGRSASQIKLPLEEIREKLSRLTPSNANDQANEDEQVDSQIHLRQGLTPTTEILTGTFEEIETRSLGTAVAGIPLNFYDLDALTQGLQRSDLIIVAGRPAMGKTSFVINVAKNVAQLHNLPVALFSLAMNKEQLTYRLLSMEVGIESGRLRAGNLHQEDWPLLGRGISSLGALPLYIDDKPNASVLEMRSLCRRLMAQQGKELGLIVIDYLQLMEGSTPDNREQEISRITRGLKSMARELNVPVIALSQLSRGVESRINKRPMLSDLGESGSIEQDADLVLMIYRDEYYNPETPDRGITEVIVTKHRNGPVGTVKLLFEPQFARFRNLAV